MSQWLPDIEERIQLASPGTAREIGQRVGATQQHVSVVITRLVRAGIMQKMAQANTKGMMANVWGVIPEKDRPPRKMIAVPDTAYRTQWQGGHHPCEVVNPWARLAA